MMHPYLTRLHAIYLVAHRGGTGTAQQQHGTEESDATTDLPTCHLFGRADAATGSSGTRKPQKKAHFHLYKWIHITEWTAESGERRGGEVKGKRGEGERWEVSGFVHRISFSKLTSVISNPIEASIARSSVLGAPDDLRVQLTVGGYSQLLAVFESLSGVGRRGPFSLCFPHPVIRPFRSQSSACREEELRWAMGGFLRTGEYSSG